MEPTNGTIREQPVPDKIVRRLDEFPDLLQALRDGDLLTARLCCAQIFNLDVRRGSLLHEQTSALHAAMKSTVKTFPLFV
jgi:hypothetical protein